MSIAVLFFIQRSRSAGGFISNFSDDAVVPPVIIQDHNVSEGVDTSSVREIGREVFPTRDEVIVCGQLYWFPHLLCEFAPTNAEVTEGVIANLNLIKSATEDVLDFAFHNECFFGEGLTSPVILTG